LEKERDSGKLVSKGEAASETLGKALKSGRLQVKGLEISAYNCHACPGMALSFGTSPIVPPIRMPGSFPGRSRTIDSPMTKSKVESLLSFNDFERVFSSLRPSAASLGGGEFWA